MGPGLYRSSLHGVLAKLVFLQRMKEQIEMKSEQQGLSQSRQPSFTEDEAARIVGGSRFANSQQSVAGDDEGP